MAKRPETYEDWLERYEHKRELAYDNYQGSGEPRFSRQEEEYSVICDALRALIEKDKDVIETWAKRRDSYDYMVSRLMKSEYTRDEVEDMLRRAVYW